MKAKKLKKTTIKKIVLLLIGALLIIIDQGAKFLLTQKNLTLIPNILNINYLQNEGVAFGIFDGDLMLIMVVTAVILGFLVKLIIHYFNENKFVYATSLILVLSGGFSNLIDRMLRGFVVDYINITLFSFPVFNIADMLITIGVIILFILIVRDLIIPERKRKEKKEKKLEKKEKARKIKLDKMEQKLDDKIEKVVKEEKIKDKENSKIKIEKDSDENKKQENKSTANNITYTVNSTKNKIKNKKNK